MTASERRASVALAGIFTLRILGLFMILPVFSLHAEAYEGYTPLLAGLAIGVYGLTQAIFQIPFGMLSDRIGRKRVITAGLIIFAAGSVVAALADSMWGVIAGRALQGLGAIGAAIIALTADLTREDQRTKAMAIIGVSIGFAFALAMMVGHALTGLVGISGLFWLTAVLAIAGIVVLHQHVPTPISTRFHRDVEPMPAQFREILSNRELFRLDAGIFILHLILTATFVALPLALRDSAGLRADAHWMVYVPVLIASAILMVPFVLYADRRNRLKAVFLAAIACLAAAELGMAWHGAGLMALVALMALFFTAFSVLESSLPSLVSRIASFGQERHRAGVLLHRPVSRRFRGGPLRRVVAWRLGHRRGLLVLWSSDPRVARGGVRDAQPRPAHQPPVEVGRRHRNRGECPFAPSAGGTWSSGSSHRRGRLRRLSEGRSAYAGRRRPACNFPGRVVTSKAFGRTAQRRKHRLRTRTRKSEMVLGNLDCGRRTNGQGSKQSHTRR